MPELLPIVKYPEPFLRRRMKPVETVDDEVREMIERMIVTMVEARGIGLAAAQVGWNARVAIVSDDGDPENALALINPEIVDAWGSEAMEEGCLSFPGVAATITRPEAVLLEYTGTDGKRYELEADELLGRCIQHENDHLDGITFLSKMTPADKLANRRALRDLESRAKRQAS